MNDEQNNTHNVNDTVDTADTAAPRINPFWLWQDIHGRLAVLLANPHSHVDFVEQIESMSLLVELICAGDADSGIATMLMLDTSQYAISQSLHVAIVATLIARRINIERADRLAMICAALTMNISIIELQGRLVDYANRLSPEMRAEIDAHPEASCAILKLLGVQNALWLDVVLQHHEERDGSGYPQHLTDMLKPAEIVHIADVYCAKVSPRSYRKAIPPNDVARSLYIQAQTTGSDVPSMLVKELGIYPPGCFVRLMNDEIAIVVRRTEHAASPMVFSLINPMGQPYSRPIQRPTLNTSCKIKEVVSREDVQIKINPNILWGYIPNSDSTKK
jgi:HD-GYP domain-containing protein (c-di-GMP phosphodiesterase class II)